MFPSKTDYSVEDYTGEEEQDFDDDREDDFDDEVDFEDEGFLIDKMDENFRIAGQ